jgi:predicted transcriptional regulator
MDLRSMTQREKKDIVWNVLREYRCGLTTFKLMHKCGIRSEVTLRKILDALEQEKRVRVIKFGRAHLYKVI